MNADKRSAAPFAFLCALFIGISQLGFGGNAAPSEDYRLVGTAMLQGDASALLENIKTGEQRFVDLQDEIDGMTVSDIQADRVILDAQGTSFEVCTALTQALAVPEASVIHGPIAVKQLPSPEVEKNTPRASNSITWADPLGGRFVSGFGTRKDPWGGGTKTHNGVDLAAPHGTRIRAAASGTVKSVGSNPLLGRYVKIEHKNGFETTYGHMYRQAVKDGQKVSLGDVIGYEGSTGRSTGPHLHFEIRKNGTPVDPTIYIPSLKK